MNRTEAQRFATGYAFGHQDASGTGTVKRAGATWDGPIAFGIAWAEQQDKYDAGTANHMPSVQTAYRSWQATSGESITTIPGVTVTSPEVTDIDPRARDAFDDTLGQFGDSRVYQAALERLGDPKPLADPLDGPAEDRLARIRYATDALNQGRKTTP